MAMAVDLLGFGPHPDDLEIGLGGTLAKHAALGHGVGLCDLTRGEMASNGTPEERVKEADAAAQVLGAAWRENLGLPDRAIGSTPDHWLRWVGNRVMFLGADQPRVPDRAREKAVVQRAMQLMYELSVLRSAISGTMPEYAWEIEYSRTADGVPYFV